MDAIDGTVHPSRDSRIAVSNLTKRFGGVVALDHVSIAVAPGSVHALIGENGAGKSTLIKCLVGAHRPDSGRISVDGRDVAFDGPAAAEAMGIRAIHQELNLVPGFSVVENVFLGRTYPRRFGLINRNAMRDRVAAHAARLAPHLTLDSAVRDLSPGQQQMAEIVRALSAEARIVIMDEPTAALGAGDSKRLFDAIRTMRRDGISVIYVSHRLDEVISLADTITVMRDGAVAATLENRDIDRNRLVALMSKPADSISDSTAESASGRVSQISAAQAGSEAGRSSSLLTIDMPATGTPENRGSITIHPGEIVGLYGLLGSGRSRLLGALFGATAIPDGVHPVFRGAPLQARSVSDAIKLGIAYVPEDRRSQGLVMAHSIRVNLTLPLLDRFRRWRALPIPDKARETVFSRGTIRKLSIKAAGPEQPIGALSGGNQQKALLGRWLGQDTALFLLDEPTRGIDIGAKAELHAEVRRLAAEGAGILFASSDLEEAIDLADRIHVLDRGRLAATLEGPSIAPDAILAACYAQENAAAPCPHP